MAWVQCASVLAPSDQICVGLVPHWVPSREWVETSPTATQAFQERWELR